RALCYSCHCDTKTRTGSHPRQVASMESQTGHEVIAVLVDHNIEGHAVMVWGTLVAGGWLELLPMTIARFADVGLPFDSSDRTVWRFAQEHGMLLLTDNRSRRGENSLEQTISSPYTFFLLNSDMELYRNSHLFV